MAKNILRERALTFMAVCAMVYLFFVQARIVMRPTGLEFGPMQLAYGYDNVAFSGKIYWDEGVTPVGIGTGVAIHINGAATSTTTTIANGNYSFTGLTINSHDVVSVFIDGESEDGMLVAKFNDDALKGKNVTGMDIYKDRLMLRTHDEDLQITTTNLKTASGSDADISAVYTLNGSDLHLGADKELLIRNTTTHVASGSLYTHDVDVRGTLTMGDGNITASGSLVVVSTGSLTITGDTTLTSISSGEILRTNGASLGNVYMDNGLRAYIRFDEGMGLNASGSTMNTASGGTLTNGALWIQTHSGTTKFYNPHSVDLDGVNDYVNFGDVFELSNAVKRTFSIWFKRKSATTEDVIFSKKAGSGAANTGYQLYIDDASDKLLFEVADGSNTYTITSNSAVTDTNWHHVGVTWNPLDTNDSNIFLDGSIDVASKAGSLTPSTATYTNSQNFIIGSDDNDKAPLQGSVDDFRLYNRTMTGTELVSLAAGNKATGSGTYRLASNLDVNGTLGIYASTLDMSGSYTVNVSGDLTVYGELRTNSGTVTLDGGATDQTIRGSTAFNQLAATATTRKTLTFETNTEQTVSGALTLQGSVNQRTTLNTTRAGSSALLIAESSGATLLKHLDVQDNNAFSGATLSCSEGCVDSGNNTNWQFLGECQDGVVNTGEQCDDGNSNNADSCPNDCQLAVCGDGVIEGEEQCETPNVGSCLSNCLLRSGGGGGGGRNSSAANSAISYYNRPKPPDGCGNAILEDEKGEECDEGGRFNGLGTCSYDCKKLYCGDGVVTSHIGEDCEPTLAGVVNGVQQFEVATCGETCSAPVISREGTRSGGCHTLFLPACGSQNQTTQPNQSTGPQCGNGIVESGEECDAGGVCSGGSFDGSVWTDRTSADVCRSGGGTTKPVSGDGCSEACTTEFCGDGIVQERGPDNRLGTSDDEQCDNGSVCSNDPAKPCRLDSECGDGNTCKYNSAKNTKCSLVCKTITAQQNVQTPNPVSKPSTEPVKPAAPEPGCGNGVIEGDEMCDDGDNNSDIKPSACRSNCTLSRCGDGVIDRGEQCDSGKKNSDLQPDSCRTSCALPRCGDGIVDSGEECDGSLYCTSACISTIPKAQCGNNVVEQGEECDDGNALSGDGCTRFCFKEQVVSVAPPVVEKPQTKVAAVHTLNLDADVVVVNPTEYAVALQYVDTTNPCSVLVMKGKNHKAAMIRKAAVTQKIPVIKNVELAQNIYNTVQSGQQIGGELCTEINALKKQKRGVVVQNVEPVEVKEPLKPSAPERKLPAILQKPLPKAPTQISYGYYPYASVAGVTTNRAPIGDTGPGVVGVIATGVAAGIGWMRKRKTSTL